MMWLELILLIVVLLWINHFKKRRSLPHGPFSIPIFGTLEIIKTKLSEGLTTHKYNEYRDFCTFFLGPSMVLIVINEIKLAKELFSKEEFSGKYNDQN